MLPPYGARRLRPTRVTDDLGRSLVFSYTSAPRCTLAHFCNGIFDFEGTPDAELLESVAAPGGISSPSHISRRTRFRMTRANGS